MSFNRDHLTSYFRIWKPFVKILETHGENDEKSLKNDTKILGN